MAVTAAWQGGLRCHTDVRDSGHIIQGDEPEALGGDNTGPNPFSLLQASLANCTIVTVVGEAELMGAPLDSLEVEVRHKQNKMVGGPRDPEQRTLKVTALRRRVVVGGDLSDEQVERLRWAAEHCPVSNTLEGSVELVTEIERATSPISSG